MQLRYSVKLLCFVGLAGAATLASAHHGWSWYGNEAFTLTAVVVEKDFGNPHDRMTVEADGQRWNLLLSPPSRSRRAGLTEEDVQLGDTITAFGHRRASGDLFEMKTERLQVGDELYNLYPDRN
jgi:hypothetical protein